MKVALIDDDPIVIEMTTLNLEDLGHTVISRTSAMGAAFWIQDERPDVVLVDLNMPGLPGDEWLGLIKEESLLNGEDHDPAFIVLSGRSVQELERVVRETCAVGYISKQDGPDFFCRSFTKIVRGLET